MADMKKVFTYYNANPDPNGTPDYQRYLIKTIAEAVLMTPDGNETIVDYINQKIADLINGAPETYDTLKEIAEYIESHKSVEEALNAAIGNKADKTPATAEQDGLMSAADKKKLDGLDPEELTYEHPENHPASMITEDATHRFTTDAEKSKWNGMPTIGFGTEFPEQAAPNSLFFLLEE